MRKKKGASAATLVTSDQTKSAVSAPARRRFIQCASVGAGAVATGALLLPFALSEPARAVTSGAKTNVRNKNTMPEVMTWRWVLVRIPSKPKSLSLSEPRPYVMAQA